MVVADAGPLIRLAAAGLLDTLRGLNRRIVLVDRVEDTVVGDLSKPFALGITDWIADRIAGLGEAALRVETLVGIGVAALRARPRTPADDALPRSALRDSGEQALRDFVGHRHPTEAGSAVVLYEDRKVASLFPDVDFPVTLMTTRAFVATVTGWGINQDAVLALEGIAGRSDLKPARIGEIDPTQPPDLRALPQPMPG